MLKYWLKNMAFCPYGVFKGLKGGSFNCTVCSNQTTEIRSDCCGFMKKTASFCLNCWHFGPLPLKTDFRVWKHSDNAFFFNHSLEKNKQTYSLPEADCFWLPVLFSAFIEYFIKPALLSKPDQFRVQEVSYILEKWTGEIWLVKPDIL